MLSHYLHTGIRYAEPLWQVTNITQNFEQLAARIEFLHVCIFSFTRTTLYSFSFGSSGYISLKHTLSRYTQYKTRQHNRCTVECRTVIFGYNISTYRFTHNLNSKLLLWMSAPNYFTVKMDVLWHLHERIPWTWDTGSRAKVIKIYDCVLETKL